MGAASGTVYHRCCRCWHPGRRCCRRRKRVRAAVAAATLRAAAVPAAAAAVGLQGAGQTKSKVEMAMWRSSTSKHHQPSRVARAAAAPQGGSGGGGGREMVSPTVRLRNCSPIHDELPEHCPKPWGPAAAPVGASAVPWSRCIASAARRLAVRHCWNSGAAAGRRDGRRVQAAARSLARLAPAVQRSAQQCS